MMSAAGMFEGNLALDLSKAGSQGFSIVEGGLCQSSGSEIVCAVGILPSQSFESVVRPAATPHIAWEKFAVLAALFAFIVSAAFGIGSAIEKNEAYADVTYENVVVANGDSVWSISEKHGVDGLSTAEVKELIRQKNNLVSLTLHPGEILKVPASH